MKNITISAFSLCLVSGAIQGAVFPVTFVNNTAQTVSVQALSPTITPGVDILSASGSTVSIPPGEFSTVVLSITASGVGYRYAFSVSASTTAICSAGPNFIDSALVSVNRSNANCTAKHNGPDMLVTIDKIPAP